MSKKASESVSGEDKYLPTVDTPISKIIAGSPRGESQILKPEAPPLEHMGIAPATVLAFAVRDGFWIVVTNDGQKHRSPVEG